MEKTTLLFDKKRRDPQAQPLIFLEMQLDQGRYLYSDIMPPEEVLNLDAGAFDAESDFDASQYYDGGQLLADFGDAVEQFGSITETASPVKADILGALASAERDTFSVSLRNHDKKGSRLLSAENIMNKPGVLKIFYPGTGWKDILEKRRGICTRLTLSSRELSIQYQEQ